MIQCKLNLYIIIIVPFICKAHLFLTNYVQEHYSNISGSIMFRHINNLSVLMKIYITRDDLMLWRMRKKSNDGFLRRHRKSNKTCNFSLFSLFKAKISTLKAEISLLKVECDFWIRGLKRWSLLFQLQCLKSILIRQCQVLQVCVSCFIVIGFCQKNYVCFGVNKLMRSR